MYNLPLYQQVSKLILKKIKNKEYTGTLPPEDMLSKQLNVSKNTIREALADLTMLGVICKRHGVGNVIMQSSLNIDYRIDMEFDFVELLREHGHRITITHTMPKPLMEVSDKLPDNQYIYYEENIYADTSVACHSKIYIPYDESSPCKIESELPIANYLKFITEYTGETIDHSTVHFLATMTDAKLSECFCLPLGTAILSWEEIYYSPKDTPIFYSDVYFNPQYFQPSMIRKGFFSEAMMLPDEVHLVEEINNL